MFTIVYHKMIYIGDDMYIPVITRAVGKYNSESDAEKAAPLFFNPKKEEMWSIVPLEE